LASHKTNLSAPPGTHNASCTIAIFKLFPS
jgi:hypothetical protein